MSLITRILGSLEARLSQPRLSLWRTIYFNFRMLPFTQAVKFPIWIYGQVRFFMLNGHIGIDTPNLSSGMIKIGINGDSFSLFDHSGYIQLADSNSKIVFKGRCRIALNTKIRVVHGVLTFGSNSRIGSDSKIICNGGDIYIGENTGVTFSCTIMNSSFHYTYDKNRHGYRNRSFNIYIGDNCWIGNQTTILGSVRLPDYSIVGSGSLVNKDLHKICEADYPMIAGRPAKIKAYGIKRVFSPKTEVKVQALFLKDQYKEFVPSEEFIDNLDEIAVEL